MEAELKNHLLTLAGTFAEAARIGVTTVWRTAINDPAFQDRLKSEKTITLRTYDRAVDWFSENWPESATWPVIVPRPDLSVAAAPAPEAVS